MIHYSSITVGYTKGDANSDKVRLFRDVLHETRGSILPCMDYHRLTDIAYHCILGYGRALDTLDLFFNYGTFEPWIKLISDNDGVTVLGGPDKYNLKYIDDDCPTRPQAVFEISDAMRTFGADNLVAVSFESASPLKSIYSQYSVAVDWRLAISDINSLDECCTKAASLRPIRNHNIYPGTIREPIDVVQYIECYQGCYR
jgi:hypothetical protein